MVDKNLSNSVFQNLLKLMSRVGSQQELEELKMAISNFFAQRVDEEIDQLWEQNVITPETLDLWYNEHMRTPYKS